MDPKEKEIRRQLLEELMQEMNGMMSEKLKKNQEPSMHDEKDPVALEVQIDASKKPGEMPQVDVSKEVKPLNQLFGDMPEENDESQEDPKEEKMESPEEEKSEDDMEFDADDEVNPRFLAKMKMDKEKNKKA